MPVTFFLEDGNVSNNCKNSETENITSARCFHSGREEDKYSDLPVKSPPSLINTWWTYAVATLYCTLYWFCRIHLWKIIYVHLPLRSTSRMVGWLAQVTLPSWIRVPVYRTYGWFFKVNLDEIEYSDNLAYYVSISHFFRRRLKPNVRTIDKDACLVSPADGCVLSFGIIEAGHLEQVKYIWYTLHGLLGPNTWGQMNTNIGQSNGSCEWEDKLHQSTPPLSDCRPKSPASITPVGLTHTAVHPENQPTDQTADGVKTSTYRRPELTTKTKCMSALNLQLEHVQYADSLLLNSFKYQSSSGTPGHSTSFQEIDHKSQQEASKVHQSLSLTSLYHILIYLAPGDYHGFHSPTDWNVFMRRHVPGRLCSVAPMIVNHMNNLYTTNERGIYVGRWDFGFFAFVAVGATTVGSIEVTSDPDLVTNRRQPSTFRFRRQHAHARDKLGPNGNHYDASINTSKQSGDKAGKITRFNDHYFTPKISQTKGQSFGHFNFGSTIILIFEAPTEYFNFCITKGSRVKVGQSIGVLKIPN